MRRERQGRALGRALAAGVLAAAILVPAGVAGAGTQTPSDGLEHGHGLKPAWKHGHGNWHRPPSGTVGAPVATGLNAPFGISVDRWGRVYVAETGIGDENNPAPGQVSRFSKGTKTVLATDAPFLDDVDAGWFGDYAYTVGEPTNTLVRTAPGHAPPRPSTWARTRRRTTPTR